MIHWLSQPAWFIHCESDEIMSKRTVLDSLNEGLAKAMAANRLVILLGEDLLDPYGGAFKVTRGLSTAYPDRVWTMPVSEAGISGLAAGMALRGLRPVVEIMFGDFLSLATDQLINHIAKFPWMYSGGKEAESQVSVPLVMRTPMGGRRGYGPTHSQTLEKLFLGIPGLRILAPCHFQEPGDLLVTAILEDDQPVLFIENKLQYLLAVENASSRNEFELAIDLSQDASSDLRSPIYPTFTLRLRGAPPAVLTLSAYGYMAELARQAMRKLAYEHEVFCELVVPTQLAPFQLQALFDSVSRSRRLLAIEEGTLTLGWGAEVLARSIEYLKGGPLIARRVAAMDLPIPASGSLEAAVFPGVDQIIDQSLEMINYRTR
jgi:acetoin:2,6-dichlorophenolindophenol oxidoreductase subunit beta